MPIARCDDPNCTCRSPELQWFTDQVLRRDATKTDYIVIPLIAGVMARCILADTLRDESDEDVSLRAEAAAVIALAERGRTDPWEGDLHAYGIIANLVFCNWPAAMAWGGVSYTYVRLGLPFHVGADARLAAAARFLGAHPSPSLTESVIVALTTTMGAERGTGLPLLGKIGRRLRVVLADRLRRENLVSWPRVLIAAVDDWTLPTIENLARRNAEAGDGAIHYMIDLTERSAAEGAKEAQRLSTQPGPHRVDDANTRDRGHDDSGEAQAAEQLVEGAVSEIKFWRRQRDVAQRERDTFAQRDARSRSRLESLEEQLVAERSSRVALEREVAALRAERDRHVERVAAEEALLDDAPPPAPDAFAGRRVLFFTGAESADTRTALAQGFWDVGAAQVDTYWTDKTRGPDVFPSDAIVAMDVSYMAHATWSAILEKAKSANAWWYWGKHGSTTMARATAAAWSKHREIHGL